MAATTTTRKAAPKKKAAARAATSEKKVEHKTIKALGLNLKIPAEMPGVLLFHYGDMEGGKVLAPVQDVLRDTIGEDAYRGLMDECRDRNLTGEEVGDALGSLMEQVQEAYGTTEGE